MDVEFTVVKNIIYILQVRPITSDINIDGCYKIESNIPNLDFSKAKIGMIGDCIGKIVIIRSLEDIKLINEPCIIITDELYPMLISKIRFIKGIFSEKGGLLSHLAILTRELNIPLITNITNLIYETGKYFLIEQKDYKIKMF